MNIVYGEMKEMSRKNEILLLALPVIMENILQTLLGTTAITAHAFGAGDREKVNRTVVHSMALALVLGIAVGLRAVKDTRTPMYVTGGSNILNIGLHRCSLQGDTFHEIAAVGIPAGMEKLIMRMGQLVYNAMILSLGTAAYVAHNVAGTIESYSYIPAMGFGLPGVWSAYALDITVRGLLLLHRFQKGVFSKTVNGV